jgi:hypothetical protein
MILKAKGLYRLWRYFNSLSCVEDDKGESSPLRMITEALKLSYKNKKACKVPNRLFY